MMNNYICGSFKKVIFQSDNGYLVGLFKLKETNCDDASGYVGKVITITGYFDDLKVDDSYKIYGNVFNHPKYGFQFDGKCYESFIPSDRDGLVTFLSSSMFPGVGEALALSIVNTLGDDCINKIINDRSVLSDVPKLSLKKADVIYNVLINNVGSIEDIVYLIDLGFSMKEASLIYRRFKGNTLFMVQSDIYSVIDDKISFLKVDGIRDRLNVLDDDERRIKACIIYCMNTLIYTNGSTYLCKNEIINFVNDYLNLCIRDDDFALFMEELELENKVKVVMGRFYLFDMYNRELEVVRRLFLLSKKVSHYTKLDDEIAFLEKENNIKYNEEQKEAIKKAMERNLLIITGGPGTGKTTIIKAIVSLYKRLNRLSYDEMVHDVALLSPTGRASKRMSDITLYSASTIHRFLKWNKESDTFGVCEYNKDRSKLIIVDESSMIDLNLFSSLLRGLTNDIKLILVGDYDQLPSVGPGLVLRDLIESERIETVKLEVLYRQDKSSYINILAKNIKENDLSDAAFEDYLDYRFLRCDASSIVPSIKNICGELIKHGYDYKKVQVMAPVYKGVNGIDNLNAILQDIFNPYDSSKAEFKYSNVIYRVNDKVLELVNMPDENVFNGDIGIITDIVSASVSSSGKTEIYIDFDGSVVRFFPNDLVKIKHGFVISIHKSQGGEFDFVIMPVIKSYGRMLYRKLIYTGITRAKRKLILLGESDALRYGASFDSNCDRKTYLKDLIIEFFDKNNP